MDSSLSVVFKALSDPNRLKIIEMLKNGEVCACNILENCEFSQPTLSHHMGILIRAGVVISRKEGKWIHYSLNSESLDSIIKYLNLLMDSSKN